MTSVEGELTKRLLMMLFENDGSMDIVESEFINGIKYAVINGMWDLEDEKQDLGIER